MLKVEHLHFSYGKHCVLEDISMIAKPGEITVVLGANGSGKSTFMRAVARINPFQGHVFYGDTDMCALPRERFFQMLGYLDQNTNCAARFTVFELVLLGRLFNLGLKVTPEDEKKVSETLEFLKLSHLANRYVSELSGGQRQMAFVAQALVKDPQVLLMDEPTSALDLQWQFRLLTQLRDITRTLSCTTIITLHHVALAAEYADNMVIFKDGRVYAHGAPKEVFTQRMLRDVYGVECEPFVDSHGVSHLVALGPATMQDEHPNTT